jgi:YidC/Oxa1 family membrane protein insertase
LLEPIGGPLLQGLGTVLSFLYDLVRSYGLAIILLTVLVRLVLLPLTIRQTRSMQEMAKLQPKVKELQRKYKGNRQKLAEETQKLYREHQVNPLGGCLPLLLQLPVFFALFAVLRATEGAFAVPADPPRPAAVQAEGTICRPDTSPSVEGASPSAVICDVPGRGEVAYQVEEWRSKNDRVPIDSPPPSLAICQPDVQDNRVAGFLCQSVLGPGHLPQRELFAAIVEDRAQFLGIELACSPTQAASEEGIRLCAGPATEGGVVPAIPYFILVALMVGTTYYQTKQMQRASAGPAAQQQQLMARIMPIFLGFISISISAGVLVYWVTTNAWQIAQQYVMLRKRAEAEAEMAKGQAKGSAKGPAKPSPKSAEARKSPKAAEGDGSKVKGSGGRRAGSRKKRRKR